MSLFSLRVHGRGSGTRAARQHERRVHEHATMTETGRAAAHTARSGKAAGTEPTHGLVEERLDRPKRGGDDVLEAEEADAGRRRLAGVEVVEDDHRLG